MRSVVHGRSAPGFVHFSTDCSVESEGVGHHLEAAGLARREVLRDLRDAANSIERNVPEGFGRFAPGEFARFLDFSRASAEETRNQLLKGFKAGYFTREEFEDADALAGRALDALAAFQRYLRSPRARRNAKRIRERMRGDAGLQAQRKGRAHLAKRAMHDEGLNAERIERKEQNERDEPTERDERDERQERKRTSRTARTSRTFRTPFE